MAGTQRAHAERRALLPSPLAALCPALYEPAPPHLLRLPIKTLPSLLPHAHDVAAALLVPSVVPPLDSHPAAEGLGVLLLLPAVATACRSPLTIGGTQMVYLKPPLYLPFFRDPESRHTWTMVFDKKKTIYHCTWRGSPGIVYAQCCVYCSEAPACGVCLTIESWWAKTRCPGSLARTKSQDGSTDAVARNHEARVLQRSSCCRVVITDKKIMIFASRRCAHPALAKSNHRYWGVASCERQQEDRVLCRLFEGTNVRTGVSDAGLWPWFTGTISGMYYSKDVATRDSAF